MMDIGTVIDRFNNNYIPKKVEDIAAIVAVNQRLRKYNKKTSLPCKVLTYFRNPYEKESTFISFLENLGNSSFKRYQVLLYSTQGCVWGDRDGGHWLMLDFEKGKSFISTIIVDSTGAVNNLSGLEGGLTYGFVTPLLNLFKNPKFKDIFKPKVIRIIVQADNTNCATFSLDACFRLSCVKDLHKETHGIEQKNGVEIYNLLDLSEKITPLILRTYQHGSDNYKHKKKRYGNIKLEDYCRKLLPKPYKEGKQKYNSLHDFIAHYTNKEHSIDEPLRGIKEQNHFVEQKRKSFKEKTMRFLESIRKKDRESVEKDIIKKIFDPSIIIV